MMQSADPEYRLREALSRDKEFESRLEWLDELRAIAEEVSARAALSEEEAATLIDEARRA